MKLTRRAEASPQSEMGELSLAHLGLPVGLTLLTTLILLALVNVFATVMSLLAN